LRQVLRLGRVRIYTYQIRYGQEEPKIIYQTELVYNIVRELAGLMALAMAVDIRHRYIHTVAMDPVCYIVDAPAATSMPPRAIHSLSEPL
jgi:hypothetical protein